MTNILENENVTISPKVLNDSKIENLTDRPNIGESFGGNGMTANDLKKSFDKMSLYIATRLKNLIDGLKSGNAGESIGITSWDNSTITNIKSMLQLLTTNVGASIIGTGKSINGELANIQQIIDNLYDIIASYQLDDIGDIKLSLGYNENTGESEIFNNVVENLIELEEKVGKLITLLGGNNNLDSLSRVNEIENKNGQMEESLGVANGIATLDSNGKLHQEIDGGKVTGGKLPLSVIPDAAFERTFFVENDQDRFSLTINEVQNGDIVVVSENVDKWYKVIDDSKLNEEIGYREIIGGTTAQAIMSKEYDPNYVGANSIGEKFKSIEGVGRTTESVKSNADSITSLKGIGYTNQTVKENADKIDELLLTIRNLSQIKSDKRVLKHLDCTHQKVGNNHIFQLNSGSNFLDNVTEYSVRAKITANIEVGDTITLTNGSIEINNILPVDISGKPYSLTFNSGIFPIIDFTVDVGGSEMHAFFKGGKSGEIGDITFEDDNSGDYVPANGTMVDYSKLDNSILSKYKVKYGVNITNFGSGINGFKGYCQKYVNGKLFITGDDSINSTNSVKYTIDGENFVTISTGIRRIMGVEYFNGKYYFFKYGQSSYICTEDLENFVDMPPLDSNSNSQFISSCIKNNTLMVFLSNKICKTIDGVTWSSISYNVGNTTSSSGMFKTITEGDYVVLYNCDKIIYSNNLTTWRQLLENRSDLKGTGLIIYKDGYYYLNLVKKLMGNPQYSTNGITLYKTNDFSTLTEIETFGLSEFTTANIKNTYCCATKCHNKYLLFMGKGSTNYQNNMGIVAITEDFINYQCTNQISNVEGVYNCISFNDNLYLIYSMGDGSNLPNYLGVGKFSYQMPDLREVVKSGEIAYIKYK